MCFLEHTVGTWLAAALQYGPPQNGDFTRGVDDKFATLAVGAVVLEYHVVTYGQVFPGQKV